jgi:hypothetical protein
MSNNCKLNDKNIPPMFSFLFLSHLILPYTQSNLTFSSLLRLLYSRRGFLPPNTSLIHRSSYNLQLI